MTSLNQDISAFFRQENLFEKTLILNRIEYLKEPDTTDTNIYFVQEGSVRLFITHKAEEQNIRSVYNKTETGDTFRFCIYHNERHIQQAVRAVNTV
ncbi:hypothetical protein [Elizabethkingia meningoseptica]|uniref:hypothetical protein n=1 Tax=Elizabethkingia meningoseptica TaxID=238 RepID=UPI0038929058